MPDPGAAGLSLEAPGLWVERIGDRAWPAGRPALFLDRDGTINVDTGYPSDPALVVLRQQIVPVVKAANATDIPVVIATNQSGIARGYFGWPEFAAVNRRVLDLLAGQGCSVDLVIACAYHEEGRPPLRAKDHPMRKPNPGMLLRAGELLGLDLARSIVVGDKPADIEAGRRAGLAAGWLVGDEMMGFAGFPVNQLRGLEDRRALLEAIGATARP
jgi:D-glycero-D-manno-heptose 1,7-bisphosphate phosphatase